MNNALLFYGKLTECPIVVYQKFKDTVHLSRYSFIFDILLHVLKFIFDIKGKLSFWSVKLFPVSLFLGFISTKPFKKSVLSADSPMYAVDCEMVGYLTNIINLILFPFYFILSLQ